MNSMFPLLRCTLLALCFGAAPAWSANDGQAPAGPDAGHGATIASAQCASCHGSDGRSTQDRTPRLAGQYPAYLFRQMVLFRNNERRSAIMTPIAASMGVTDMRDVVAYYSQQPAAADPTADRALTARGEAIFLQGQSGSGGQPCARCHSAVNPGVPGGLIHKGWMAQGGMMGAGMMGGGMMPGSMKSGSGMTIAPRLQGQSAGYLLEQLNRYAQGERPGSLMQQAAAALAPADRRAVAAYLAGQQ